MFLTFRRPLLTNKIKLKVKINTNIYQQNVLHKFND